MTIPVYVSYHAKDESFKQELYAALSMMKRKKMIGLSDHNIAPGAKIEETVSDLLDSAKIILLLCSSDLLNDDWHWHYEVEPARKAHALKSSKVVPVILRPMSFGHLDEIAGLQALPKDAKPVTKWNNRDEAWLDVQQGLERIVEEIQKRVAQ